jgi:phosphoglycolate phosphatase-like HAD superfamily hydrolase
MKHFKFFEVRVAVEALVQKLLKAIDEKRSLRGLKPVNAVDVRVIWSKTISTAAITDKGVIYLADRPDDEVVTQRTLDRYCAKVVHELLHRVYTNFYVNGQGQYLHQLHNALEDAFIENSAIAAGLLGNIGSLMGALADMLATEALKHVKNWDDPAQFPFLLAIMGRKHGTVKLPCPEWVQPIFEEAVIRVAKAKDSRDTLDIAEWVLAQLQTAQKQPSNPKPEDGKPKQGDKPEQDGEPAPSGDKGDDKADGGGKPAPKGDKGKPIKADSFAEDVHGADGAEGEGSQPEGTVGYGSGMKARDGAHLGSSPRDITGNINAKAKKQVRDIFEKTGLDEFSGNKKAGTLDVGALAGVGVGKTNVFKRRIEEEGVDSAVIILVDISSSMWDDGKDTAARKAAAELTRTLCRAGVEVCIVTFNSMHSVAHKFSTNKAKLLNTISRISFSGSTSDYAAVRTCHTMLAKHNAERKVLFVMTDGLGQVVDTRAQVAAGRRLGITTLAVGIGQRVENIYGDESAYVKDATKLGEAMFGKIKLAK